MSATDGVYWTAERTAKLRQLWADGLSASRIASYLGAASRNAVIGKVKRLGIQQRDKSVAQARASRRPDQDANPMYKLFPHAPHAPQNKPSRVLAGPPPMPAKATRLAPFTRAVAVDYAPPIRPAPPPLIPPTPVVLDTRPRHPCRWPVNAEGEAWSFCEAPRDPRSKSYCHDHHARSLDAPARQRFLAKRA